MTVPRADASASDTSFQGIAVSRTLSNAVFCPARYERRIRIAELLAVHAVSGEIDQQAIVGVGAFGGRADFGQHAIARGVLVEHEFCVDRRKDPAIEAGQGFGEISGIIFRLA